MGTTTPQNKTTIDLYDFYVQGDPLELLNTRTAMRAKVEAYWKKAGNPMPRSITQLPTNAAFRERHIATARREDFVFARTAGILGFHPVWSEYKEDKYVGLSKPKTSLLKLPLKGGNSFSLAKPRKWEGERICDIKTEAGLPLVEFHHKLWSQLPGPKTRFDCSQWVRSFGHGKAGDYYMPALSVFIAHGVLFNDFHVQPNPLSSKGSVMFTKNTVEKAFSKAKEAFGCKPLIYRFTYQEGFEVYPQLSYSRRSQGGGDGR